MCIMLYFVNECIRVLQMGQIPIVIKMGFFVDFVISARGRALKCTSNLSFVLRIVHVHFDGYPPNGLHESASTKSAAKK